MFAFYRTKYMKISGYFGNIRDFRVIGRCTHLLSDILGLVIVGIVADCDDFLEIADYGKSNISFLRTGLGFSLKHGIPSVDTFERVLKHIKTNELEKSYLAFIGDLSLSDKQVCIDGKELRNTIPHGKKHALIQMVNAWVCENGLSFGQSVVDKKSNEITAIPALLETVDCKGSIISIDAIGCQKEIVSTIRNKSADYVISLKKNQGTLFDQTSDFMLKRKEKLPCSTFVDKDHGRGEIRRVYVANAIDLIDERDNWCDLNSITMIERTRIINEKMQTSTSFYISSLRGKSPEDMAGYIRNHWHIENKLHWQLDVTFKEDNSKVKNQKAVVNLHQIRKWALHLLKKDETQMSFKRKRKKAHRDNEYLKKVLCQEF
jgi:predicted transposase YbfD/YdcC